MREMFENCFCELDKCCKPLIDNLCPCSDCEHLYCQEFFNLEENV